jgi:hypothetical protein
LRALLLLREGYRLELERYAPLDRALSDRRWDLFDLLLERGANLKSVGLHLRFDVLTKGKPPSSTATGPA